VKINKVISLIFTDLAHDNIARDCSTTARKAIIILGGNWQVPCGEMMAFKRMKGAEVWGDRYLATVSSLPLPPVLSILLFDVSLLLGGITTLGSVSSIIWTPLMCIYVQHCIPWLSRMTTHTNPSFSEEPFSSFSSPQTGLKSYGNALFVASRWWMVFNMRASMQINYFQEAQL